MKSLKDIPVNTQEKVNDNMLFDIAKQLSSKFKNTKVLADNAINSDVKYYIDTNVIPLNKILGQGLPSGKILEIYGKESSGKTTLVQHFIAEANKAGSMCIYVDGEYSLDKKRAKELGMDFDKIIYYTPETLEEAFNFIDESIELLAEKKLKKPMLICLDSLAAFPTEADLKGEIGDLKVGGSSRINAQAFRVLTAKLAKANATLLIINQLRDNPGVMFGEKESTPGGRALKFFASIRIQVKKKDFVKDDADKLIGLLTEIKITKNKVSVPFGQCILPIYFNRENNCIDNAESIFYFLEDNELLTKEGQSFTVEGIPDKFKKANFKEVYEKNKEAFDKLVFSV